MRLDFSAELRFEGTTIEATGDAVAEALLRLDPGIWFASVPITRCAEGELEVEDGVLQIEDGSDECKGLEDAVRGRIGDSCELRHHDGERDEREDELPH